MWWYMSDGRAWNINIETANFGAEDIMWIRQGKNAKGIAIYIQNQLKEDQIAEQLTFDVDDPFTGRKK